jgi:hypothetical protein
LARVGSRRFPQATIVATVTAIQAIVGKIQDWRSFNATLSRDRQSGRRDKRRAKITEQGTIDYK